MSTAFERISKYCADNGKSIFVRNVAFSIFQEKLEQGKITSPSLHIDSLADALLADASMFSHVMHAETMIGEQIKEDVAKGRRKDGFRSFCVSIASGVAGNFAYSLLLVLVFVLARDQIRSWLNDVSSSEVTNPAQHERRESR